MKPIISLILSSLCLLVLGGAATAQHDAGNIIKDAASVNDAVTQMKALLEKQGFEISLTVDHAGAAQQNGLELRPTTVIMFRKPFLDKRLLKRNPSVGIDLPFKVLVYEDADGGIRLKSNDVGYLVDRHELYMRDFALHYIDTIMDQFGLNEKGIMMVESQLSVQDTVGKLRSVLLAANFRIPLQLDFHVDVKHKRPSSLLVFGNPNVGTQLMQNSQEIGLDLPQKFLVFEDRNGEVKILYNDPHFIARRAGIQGLDLLLGNIASALQNFASQGANP